MEKDRGDQKESQRGTQTQAKERTESPIENAENSKWLAELDDAERKN